MNEHMRRAGLGMLVMLTACTAAQQSSAPQAAQDAVIATTLKAKLAAIDVDSTTAVRVDVHDGHVILSGEVRRAAQRKQFEMVAREAAGVKSVTDKTRVNTALRGARDSLGDAALATKVMGALAAQSGINAFSIHAAVRAGTVTLRGTVPTQAIKTTVLETARKVDGVKVLSDHLTVKE